MRIGPSRIEKCNALHQKVDSAQHGLCYCFVVMRGLDWFGYPLLYVFFMSIAPTHQDQLSYVSWSSLHYFSTTHTSFEYCEVRVIMRTIQCRSAMLDPNYYSINMISSWLYSLYYQGLCIMSNVLVFNRSQQRLQWLTKPFSNCRQVC